VNPEQPGASGRRGNRPVDLDLLADYASGALEGTSEHARAAALVESDPAWSTALDNLRVADALVRADLARLAAVPEPFPEDLTARLDRALTDMAPPRDDSPETNHDKPVSLREVRARRRYRIAAATAVAAGLLGLAVPAGSMLLGVNDAAEKSMTTDAADSESDAQQPGAATGEGERSRKGSTYLGRGYPVPVAASGTDYTRDTLSAVRGQHDIAAAAAPAQVPKGLSGLLALPALDDCLTSIRSAYPGTVTIVDYARFEGSPALIVAITEATAGNRIVVVGPDCGHRGADEQYTATG